MTSAAGGRGGRGLTGDPWTLRVATVGEGTSKQIWKADAGNGSVFHAIVAENQLAWTAGNRIVFPWEKDGWSHLYSVPADGGAPLLLTPGNFEVEHVACSEDGKQIVYSSNQNDIDRRHIWTVSAAAGPPTASPEGDSLEWSPCPSPAASPTCAPTPAIPPARPIRWAPPPPAISRPP